MSLIVSVIMPVYNQENFLVETIESVINQTYSDFEFLILDDGSTDGSAKIIKEYTLKDKRIKAFFETNSGRSDAANKLVRLANGKYCALLDADDIMLPYRLEKQLAFHQNNEQVDASSCHCYYINEKGMVLKQQRYPFLESLEELKKAKRNKEFVQCAFTGLMITKQSFLEVGGVRKQFDPCDDFEFFNRFIDYGFVLLVIQEALMKYRIHPSAITVKNPLYVYDKLDYTYECIRLRRNGKSEITFEAYMNKKAKKPYWNKLNNKRFHYSQFYFRKAGYFVMSKMYGKGLIPFIAAFVLSPNYILKRLNTILKS